MGANPEDLGAEIYQTCLVSLTVQLRAKPSRSSAFPGETADLEGQEGPP